MNSSIVNVIILNYKNYEDTIECIKSVLDSNYNSLRIIVIDNNSGNDSVEMITKYINNSINISDDFLIINSNQVNDIKNEKFVKCYFIKSDKNLGYGGGNNLGIKLSLSLDDAEYIWILNNDTLIDQNAISAQKTKMKHNKKALICGSKIYYFGTNIVQCLGGARFNKWTMTSKYITDKNIDESEEKIVEENIDYISGASMFFKKDYFIRYGLFDERFFLYFEEIDITSRVNDRQNFLSYSSNSVVYHKEGASIGSSSNLENKSLVSEYNSFKSRIKFTKKHYPFRLLLVYLLGFAYMFHRASNKKFKHSFQIFKAMVES